MRSFRVKPVKNLILIIAMLLSVLSCLAVFSQPITQEYKTFKPFKMVFLPDIHLSFEKKNDWILYNESLVIFQEVTKSLSKESALDFIVFGGDLTDNRDKTLADLPMFLDTLAEVKIPYFAILGDRDADVAEGYSKQDFCVEFRKNGFLDKEKTYWSVEPVQDVLLIGLDTSQQNRFSGIIDEVQLNWLENTLQENKNKFTVITMHHPALTSCDQDKDHPWKNFVLTNSKEFIAVIKKYPQIKLVLSGHHHINQVKNVNNTLFVSTPSIVTYPNQYKTLTVYPDRIEVKNEKISFKQIIKKAKKTITETEYAKQYNSKAPKQILEHQEGDSFSKRKIFFYNSKLSL